MGYDRSDRGGYRGSNWNRDRGQDRDYGRQPQGYDHEDRGFFDRAGDEVRSWFGDEDAERRRRMDERGDVYDGRQGHGREERGGYGREQFGHGGFGGGRFGGGRHQEDHRSFGGGGRGYEQPRDERFGQGAFASHENRNSSDRTQGRDQDHHDASYRTWRDRQMAQYDRDYEDYRREHQQRFDNDFASWRTTRETQRGHLKRAQEHQEVVGSDGKHIGTVDKVRGDHIILTRNDQDAGGRHHSIPCSWIESIEEKVTVNRTAEEAKRAWQDAENESDSNERGGLFGGNRDRDENDRGPGNLNRSFSGTY